MLTSTAKPARQFGGQGDSVKSDHDMRILLRTIGLIALAMAVIAGVNDGIRSVTASQVVIEPLGSTWYAISPDTLNLAQAIIQRNVHPYLWDPVIQWILLQPSWAVFPVLSLFFYLITWRRNRPAVRFVARDHICTDTDRTRHH